MRKIVPPPTPFMTQCEELVRAFAQRANGHDRDAIVSAAATLLVRVIAQSNKTLPAAEEHLDDLVARMKAVLKARHYAENGMVQNQNIFVPNFPELVSRALNGTL